MNKVNAWAAWPFTKSIKVNALAYQICFGQAENKDGKVIVQSELPPQQITTQSALRTQHTSTEERHANDFKCIKGIQMPILDI